MPEFDQDELAEVLGRNRVGFGRLFGSQARDKARSGSDVDIAVLISSLKLLRPETSRQVTDILTFRNF